MSPLLFFCLEFCPKHLRACGKFCNETSRASVYGLAVEKEKAEHLSSSPHKCTQGMAIKSPHVFWSQRHYFQRMNSTVPFLVTIFIWQINLVALSFWQFESSKISYSSLATGRCARKAGCWQRCLEARGPTRWSRRCQRTFQTQWSQPGCLDYAGTCSSSSKRSVLFCVF